MTLFPTVKNYSTGCIVAAGIFFAALCVGCGGRPEHHDAADFQITAKNSPAGSQSHSRLIATTNYPLCAIAELIAGDEFEVWCPTLAATVPSRKQIKKLQRCDVVFTNGPGADFASWLNLVSLERDKICQTTTHTFELTDFIQINEHRIVHSHGDEGEHSHPWMVPHCWLDPRLALLQAQAVRDRLCEIYPEHQQTLHSNFDRAIDQPLKKLAQANVELANRLQGRGVSWLLSDPRLTFLARAIDLKHQYLMWFDLPDAATALQQLSKMTGQQPSQKKIGLLCGQSIGPLRAALPTAITAINIDLIEQPIAGETFIERLRANFEIIERGIGIGSGSGAPP